MENPKKRFSKEKKKKGLMETCDNSDSSEVDSKKE